MQVLSLGSLDFFPCSYGGKIIEHRSALTALKRDVFVCVCVRMANVGKCFIISKNMGSGQIDAKGNWALCSA